MQQHLEDHGRPRSAASAACFAKNALIVATLMIGGMLGVSEGVWAQGQPITFSIIGDVPYSTSEKADFQQHMDDHDLYSPADLLAHLGDIKSGSSACDESWYRDMATSLKSLFVPAFIVPGDNEWNDCTNPTQAWNYWVAHLMAIELNFCGLPVVERQTVRPENFAFVKSGVLFIGINKVAGGLSTEEKETRLQQDADWVTYHTQTKANAVRAVIILAQASASGSPFESQFRAAAVAFAKPVLYAHGDGHTWTVTQPYLEPNITRIQVNRGTATNPPVQITVTMDAANMFLINQDPWPPGTLPLNRPPCVEAGPDLQAVLADGAALNGKATDDGEPIPANLVVSWTQVGGPATASFDNSSSPTTTAHFPAEGTYDLQLTATDGAFVTSDTVRVDVHINPPPIVTITAPASGSVFEVSQTVTLMGSASDMQDGNLTASLSWTSSLDGALGTGGTISTSTLSIGVHTITASATDSGAETGSSAITVTVGQANGPPTAVIVAPGDGSSFSLGEVITFNGTANDPNEGNLTASLTWTSSVDGAIGSGGSFSTSTLSAGTHVITASVTDSGGASGSAQITLTVGPVTLEVRVSASSDDAEESSSGSVSLTSTDLELVADGSNQTVGMRFNGVGVPRGATILNAWVQFQTDEARSEATSLTFQGQAADNAATFTTTAANISSRPRTTAAVPWSPVPWNTVGAAGADQQTPDLKSIVQEIVSRPAWSSGNSLAILVTGTGRRTAESYNGVPNGAPLLHVEFTTAPTPPVVNAGPDQAVDIPNLASLNGTVSDDGLPNPPGAVTTAWSQVGGTGSVTFADPTAIDTTASFSEPSTYVLRLTASDGAFVASDDVTITVSVPSPDITVVPNPHDYGGVVVGGNASQTFAITNVGSADLQVTATSLLGGDMGEFAITLGGGSFSVAPGTTHNLDVRFAPLSAGPKTTTLSLTTNDPDENPFLVPLTGTGIVAGTMPPTFVEVQQGGSASASSVTTATNLTGVAGHLYLAAVSTKPYRTVGVVAGLGLTWTRLATQCGGRKTTGIDLWWAQGAATTGLVTATLASAPSTAVIAVARYSGVAAANPVTPLVAGNTNGVDGGCANGTDSSAYSFNVSTTDSNVLVFGAVASRNRTHTQGSGYTERVEASQGSGGNAARIAFVDRPVPVATSLTLNGSLSGPMDWAVIGVQLRP